MINSIIFIKRLLKKMLIVTKATQVKTSSILSNKRYNNDLVKPDKNNMPPNRSVLNIVKYNEDSGVGQNEEQFNSNKKK